MFYFDFPLDNHDDDGAIFLADFNSGDGLSETFYGDMNHDVYFGSISIDDDHTETTHMA